MKHHLILILTCISLLACFIQTCILVVTSPIFLIQLTNNSMSVALAQATYTSNYSLEQEIDQLCQDYSICITKAERLHLIDVARLFYNLKIISLIAFTIIVCLYRYSTFHTLRYIHQSAAILIGLLLVIIPIALIFWNQFFMLFHHLFFPQGNWSFPAGSAILSLFPEDFWFRVGFCFLAFLLSQLVLLFLSTRLNDKIQS